MFAISNNKSNLDQLNANKMTNERHLPEMLLNNVAMMLIDPSQIDASRMNGRERLLVDLRGEDVIGLDQDVRLRKGIFRSSLRKSLSMLRRSKSSDPSAKETSNDSDTSNSNSPTDDPRIFRKRYASDFQIHRMFPSRYSFIGQPPPALVEYPLSHDDVSDLDEVSRHHLDPALLHGSSCNFGSAGARSAPSTPQGLLGSSPTAAAVAGLLPGAAAAEGHHHHHHHQQQQGGAVVGAATTAGIGPPSGGAAALGAGAQLPLPRSPSHHGFGKYDKNTIKQLSCSTPAMTAQAQSPEPPSPKAPPSKGSAAQGRPSSKTRQKKFHRHFGTQCGDHPEVVLNYYSCALQADILLQGHLYITKNYFAFYSNVFGYVTKILIPILSVDKITKEKTARIIPNAVGIATQDEKHVFGSLMSRDSTFKFMNEVWDTALKEMHDIPSNVPSEESDSSGTREESGKESDINSRFATCIPNKQNDAFISSIADDCIDAPSTPKSLGGVAVSSSGAGNSIGGASSQLMDSRTTTIGRATTTAIATTYEQIVIHCKQFVTTPRQNLFLMATTLLLVLLFLSAAFLLYRIGKVQHRFNLVLQDDYSVMESGHVYDDLLHWQTNLHSKSAGAVHTYIDNNLHQLSKVRQNLEALRSLLMPDASKSGGVNPQNDDS